MEHSLLPRRTNGLRRGMRFRSSCSGRGGPTVQAYSLHRRHIPVGMPNNRCLTPTLGCFSSRLTSGVAATSAANRDIGIRPVQRSVGPAPWQKAAHEGNASIERSSTGFMILLRFPTASPIGFVDRGHQRNRGRVVVIHSTPSTCAIRCLQEGDSLFRTSGATTHGPAR
jgi:hypothetical protein